MVGFFDTLSLRTKTTHAFVLTFTRHCSFERNRTAHHFRHTVSRAPVLASNQTIGSAFARPPTVATQSRSVVLDALDRSPFIPDSENSDDLHGAKPPPPKRSTPSRTTNCVPPPQEEVADDLEEGEMFWDGELRQTANMHVDPGRNGEDGKPVFRLSEIIGDVRYVVHHSWSHSSQASDPEITD